jgi:phage terminase large subunit-like protein
MFDLKADFEAHRIIYNNNPVDKMCLFNTQVKSDTNGNIQPCKALDTRKRIDGTAALLDAYVVWRDKKAEYQSMI